MDRKALQEAVWRSGFFREAPPSKPGRYLVLAKAGAPEDEPFLEVATLTERGEWMWIRPYGASVTRSSRYAAGGFVFGPEVTDEALARLVFAAAPTPETTASIAPAQEDLALCAGVEVQGGRVVVSSPAAQVELDAAVAQAGAFDDAGTQRLSALLEIAEACEALGESGHELRRRLGELVGPLTELGVVGGR